MRRTRGRGELRLGAAGASVALVGLIVALGVVCAAPSWATSGWTRVPHNEPVFGGSSNQLMQGVLSTPSGFVAVGWDQSVTAAAVWNSVDGTTWTRATHMEGMFGGPDGQYMYDVAQGPGNAVAVGSSGPSGNQDAAVWTGGGPIWKRVVPESTEFGGSDDQIMWSVAAAGPGLVAVGVDGSGGDSDAAVWYSSYGARWTRVPHNETIFGGMYTQWMRGVTAGGPGVVAVGFDQDLGAAAVWTSVDGMAWTRVPHSEAVFGGPANQDMSAVVAGGPGLVAVGEDYYGGDVDAAVWTSVDGLTWTRVPHNEAVFGGPGNQQMLDVAVGGPGLIAVGYDNPSGDRDAAVWTSVDGLTWTRVPHDEATFGGVQIETMNAIAVNASGLAVAAGTQWDSAAYDYDAAVWTYTAPTPPPPPEPTSSSPSSPEATSTPGVTPSSSGSETSAPLPSATASPSLGPAAEPATPSSGWGSTPYVIGGSVVLILAAGFSGWIWGRRRL